MLALVCQFIMGSLSESEKYELLLPFQNSLVEPCARHVLNLAVNYSFEGAEPDGHWYGELK